MTDQDRIRLAEAMGWVPTTIYTSASGRRDVTRWRSPKGRPNMMLPDLPDPFTDANDDYAVLEWMRTQEKEMKWAFEVAYFDQTLKRDGIDILTPRYRVGDYARAALKVIDQE